ncbi:MAG: hypothetical protein WCV56_05200 [Candidatus Omnitrophota bacterium]
MLAKFFKTVLGLAMIPVVMGTAKAFHVAISDISVFSGMLRILERGVLSYLLFHLLIIRPVYLYVLGHECVHVLATWLCGGQVVSFNVTPSGGNVVTSKTNFFIELSPYFVPIYTILLGVIYTLMKAMDKTMPNMSIIFIFLIGVTLAFHFVMTAEVMKMQQSDIAKSGLLFSLVIIFISNLVVVMAVFSPLFRISFVDFIRNSYANSVEYYRLAYLSVLSAIDKFPR